MKKIQKAVLTILLHITLWFIFLCLPALFNPHLSGKDLGGFINDLLLPPRWHNAVLLMAVFYFNYYIAIPRLYMARKYLLFTLSLVGCVGIFLLLNYTGAHDMPPPMEHMHYMPPSGGFMPPPPNDHGVLFWSHNNNGIIWGNSFYLFMFLLVYSFSFALCLYEQWQKTKELMLQTEISFLKAQINPHFLFNTLNSIYSLALTKSDNAPGAVVKLSNMMRYSVSEANHNYVSLSKELEYITNYIELQRLRVTRSIKINYEVSGDADGKQIAPFLLIPFVENAFKYGVNSEEDSDIDVKINIGSDGLLLKVANKKVNVRYDKDTGIGLGIATTEKRLKLLYPGRYTLDVNDNNDSFSILLQIGLE